MLPVLPLVGTPREPDYDLFLKSNFLIHSFKKRRFNDDDLLKLYAKYYQRNLISIFDIFFKQFIPRLRLT